MRRWVLDTNVLVSAALAKHSISRRALEAARATGLVLQSADTLDELITVLTRPKFDRYVTETGRQEFLALISELSFFVATKSHITICRDAKDNKFLELAVDGYGDAIISGDQDLLTLSPFEGIPILTPAQFLDQQP